MSKPELSHVVASDPLCEDTARCHELAVEVRRLGAQLRLREEALRLLNRQLLAVERGEHELSVPPPDPSSLRGPEPDMHADEQLRTENARLRAELDALMHTKLFRWARPLRWIYGRARN